MQQFIQYFKEQAPDLDLVYYDSMTVDGKMDWQNALTEENLAYLVSEDGDPVADAMFLNLSLLTSRSSWKSTRINLKTAMQCFSHHLERKTELLPSLWV